MMPMPKPGKKENKDEFLDRCMGDDLMVEDYPDAKQRYAVCNSLWAQEENAMPENDMERRSFTVQELRVLEVEGENPKIRGYAAVFNSLSDDLGGFVERIQPGAFAKTLQEADVRALWNHNPDVPLGRTKNGTLQLEEDEVGLRFEVEPPDTQQARDIMASIRRGDVDQMSFGFTTVRDKWEQLEEQVIRTLLEVKLFDVSPVTFPAYPQTSANVRSKVAEFSQPAVTVAAPGGEGGQEPTGEAHPAEEEKAKAQARNALRKRKIQLNKLTRSVK